MLDVFKDDQICRDTKFLSEKHFFQTVLLESNVIFSSIIDGVDKRIASLKTSNINKPLNCNKMDIVHKSNFSSERLNGFTFHINIHGKLRELHKKYNDEN